MRNISVSQKTLRKPYVSLSLLDKAINFVSPTSGLKRIRAKSAMSALGTSGYITPNTNRRSMLGWFTSKGSADKDTLGAIDSSRAGSRDLYMNTPMATAAIRRMRTNVIGYGLNLQSRIDREFLGLSDEQADIWERKAEREFKLWSTSKDCDITRVHTFQQLQSLCFISYLMSGDVFTLMPKKKVSTLPYTLRIQLIESDQVSNPNNNPDSILNNKIRGGIEVDENGAPTIYYIRSKHPGDYSTNFKWIQVPAFGSRTGKKNVLHIFNRERPGQRRGMPFLAPIMEQLKQLTRLSDAELMGAIIASFFTVFIKNVSGNRPADEAFVPDDMIQEQLNVDADRKEKNYELGSGNIMTLDEEQEVDIADPKRPNDSFEPFFLAIVKQLGAALEMPHEFLLMSFSSNYSAARGAIIEAWKSIKMYRKNFVMDFTQPIYEEFITEAVLLGRLSAPGFLTDPLSKMAWCGSRWGGSGQGHIDPMKETKASILRIKNQLSTYEDEAQLIGNDDWERSMDRLSREEKLLKEKGLLVDEDMLEGNIEEQIEEGVSADT